MLLKMRIVVPLIVLAIISATVAANGDIPLEKIAILMLSGGLASAGAACLNHYLDRDIDAVMERTKRRPIPSGEIGNPVNAALLGIVLISLGIAVATRLGWLSLGFIALGAFFYVLVYTFWLKRTSPLSVVLGGGAGSCAALAGWTAVDPSLSMVPAFLGLLVFSWTPSHFWSLAIVLEDDYRKARVPMLPVLVGRRMTAWVILGNTVITVVVSLLPYYYRLFQEPYLLVAVAVGAVALYSNVSLALSPTKSAAWRSYKLSGMQLGLLLLAMLVDTIL